LPVDIVADPFCEGGAGCGAGLTRRSRDGDGLQSSSARWLVKRERAAAARFRSDKVGAVRGLRRLLSRASRVARVAEAEGRYRDAAKLHAEAGEPRAAAEALLFLAGRAASLHERAEAYQDALRFLADDAPRRAEVEVQLGLTRLEDATLRGVGSADARRVLAEAAACLEAHARPAEAAAAWELLGREEELARCLAAAGEVERLEALLSAGQRAEAQARTVRAAVAEYELACALGQRLEARAALLGALAATPAEPSLVALLRALDARLVAGTSVTLHIGDGACTFVASLPVGLGRDAEIRVRGASVSRRHAEIARGTAGAFIVRDAGSRNGTLVGGLPLGAPLALDVTRTIGLGDDVSVTLVPRGGVIEVEVERGPDRGARFRVGEGVLSLPDVRASVRFEGGFAQIVPADGVAIALGARVCRGAVVLLRGDELRIDDVTVSVPA
jgi:hypothetical protein